jgi:rare lipoprotein A (peptidoglycan hydrolase)
MTKVGAAIALGFLLHVAWGTAASHAAPPEIIVPPLPLQLAQAPAPATPPPAAGTPDASTGKAAYYGKKFQGRKTASGEPFDMNKLTAASNDHPFGTRLKVTNVANGKSVEVRVNDRLSGGDRIVDLSYAAAQQIGMVKAGLAEVKVEVSAPAPEKKKG